MFPEHIQPQQRPLSVVAGPAGQGISPPVQRPGQVPLGVRRLPRRAPEDGLEVGQGQLLLKVTRGQGEGGGGNVHSGSLLQLGVGDVGEGEEVQSRPVRPLHHDVVSLLSRGCLPGAVGVLLPGDHAVRHHLSALLRQPGQPPQPQAQCAAGGQGGRPRRPAGNTPPPGGGQLQQPVMGLGRDRLPVHIEFVIFHGFAPFPCSSSDSSSRSFSRARASRERTVPGFIPVRRAISSVA